MKIIDCKLRYLNSMVRSLKITWRVRLDDGRIVKVIDYRSYEDDIVEQYAEGDFEYHEKDLAGQVLLMTELADYTLYEV
jgi:hypothetical protein